MRIRKKNKTKLQIAKDNTQNAIHEVNTQINTLGGYTKGLHEALTEIQYTLIKYAMFLVNKKFSMKN